jgi:hypothetical protein
VAERWRASSAQTLIIVLSLFAYGRLAPLGA